MSRLQVILMVAVALLVVVLWYLFLLQPQREALAAVEEQILAQQAEQATVQLEIRRLETVREVAPELEAEMAAAQAIIPQDAALPSALRQLQQAADEAGLVLRSVSTAGRPTEVGDGPAGLTSIDVSLQLSGGYFQVVDFLRRVENPTITPRGLRWNTIAVSKETYPVLGVTLSGRVFAVLTEPVPPPPPDPDGAEPGADEDAAADEVEEVPQ